MTQIFTKNRIAALSKRMATSSSRTRFTGEQVIALLDEDGEDGVMERTFFPDSDEELGLEEIDNDTEGEAQEKW